jgi:uncharacterized protein (DUF169 family)
MDHEKLSERLSEGLGLQRPPVALAFVDGPPEGIEEFAGEAPSACSFWPRAETRVFYAPAQAHFNCPIGAMTMGFDMPEEIEGNLMELVGRMVGNGYIAEDEPPSIPRDQRRKAGIVYGPLARFPLQPDVILTWVTPEQAMLYNEAAGSARWAQAMTATLFGRPTCAALPAALGLGRPTMSLGCSGMRVFTGIPGELMLVAVPAADAERFVDALQITLRANRDMDSFYRRRLAQVR